MFKVVSSHDQAEANRDLAKRARRRAEGFPPGTDRTRLVRYAEELERQAGALDGETSVARVAPIIAPTPKRNS
jgi:hypothetical protein